MHDEAQLVHDSESESPKIRKDNESIKLMNEKYNTPKTSLLLFHFDPHPFISSKSRLKECSIQHSSVENKDIYLFRDFYMKDESRDMQDYSRNATFSRSSYGSQESKEKGEEPARSMDNKEKWVFFAKPPQPIKEIYKFLSLLSLELNADISTLPWDICDEKLCASAVATNRVERSSKESMEMGKHEDFNTEKGLPFGIPILYSKEQAYYPCNFINGSEGNPWLVSFMLYATAENFKSSYGLGTVFCKKNGEITTRVPCEHMNFVIFEGDILHSIEESTIPADIHTWRVSYVFKLLINPKVPNKSMKEELRKLLGDSQ